jgi:hypothetical protein
MLPLGLQRSHFTANHLQLIVALDRLLSSKATPSFAPVFSTVTPGTRRCSALHFAGLGRSSTIQPTNFAGPHLGIGVNSYAWATSPLRRYSDMLVHYQLKAYLRNECLPFTKANLSTILASVDAAASVCFTADCRASPAWPQKAMIESACTQSQQTILIYFLAGK